MTHVGALDDALARFRDDVAELAAEAPTNADSGADETPAVPYVLLIYDRTGGSLVRTQRFEVAAEAMAARFEAEAEFRSQSQVEIVALTAASEDDLRTTHGRCFLGLDDLAARMV